MFSHVMLSVNDLEASRKFYDALLGALGNGSTLGFAVQSPEQGNGFHAAGLAHGGTTCESPPGFREGPSGKIYLAYLRDPDGNKICALHRPAK
jgi:catechol 2,3-dioxygenase-like lactoylglutathione lyase family enzyme